jgi:hypothetical protein
MAKKKTKKKIIKKKKPARRKSTSQKRTKEIPENVYGQKIDLAQEITPLVVTVEQNEIEEPEEADELQIEENEIEQPILDEEEIIVPKIEKDLNLRQKNLLMYVAIGCIMCVIIVFWLFNARSSFGQGLQESKNNEMSTFFTEIQNKLDNIGQTFNSQKKIITDISSKAKSLIIQQQLKNEITNKVMEQIENSNSNLNINQ